MKNSKRNPKKARATRGGAAKKSRRRAKPVRPPKPPAKARAASRPSVCSINIQTSRVMYRALTQVAESWCSHPLALEMEAAELLLRAALVNVHLLKPHMDSLAAYCEREFLDQYAYMETLIASSLLSSKGEDE
jgi:hypothetical protein